MRSFSKLLESKESKDKAKKEILQKIGISIEEIKDIFQELIDEGWEFKTYFMYLSTSGSSYEMPSSTKYYPTLKVELRREVIETNDPRQFDGSVHYEDNTEYLKMIYSAIGRCDSTIDSDGIKVYYSIRSINEIGIRITSSKEESSIGLAYEDFLNGMDEISEYDIDSTDYKIEGQGHFTNDRTIEIHPIESKHHNVLKNFDMNLCGDRIIKKTLDSTPIRRKRDGDYKTNKEELIKLINRIITTLYKNVVGDLKGFTLPSYDVDDDDLDEVKISYLKDGQRIDIMTIYGRFHHLGDVTIETVSKLFNSKSETVKLYSATLYFKLKEF